MNVTGVTNRKLSLAAIATGGNGTVAYQVPAGYMGFLVSAWVSRTDTATATYDAVASIHRVAGAEGASVAVANSNMLANTQCFPSSFDPAQMPTVLLSEGESVAVSRTGAGTLAGVFVLSVLELKIS